MNPPLIDPHAPPGNAAALEARFGFRVAARLSTASNDLPHDIQERLRIARMQAVAHAKSRQLAVAVQPAVSITGDARSGALMMQGGPDLSRWGRLGILVPLLVLVLGLVGIQEWRHLEQISAAAEIDTALLGDTLPPAAYTDPGFAEFLLQPVGSSQP